MTAYEELRTRLARSPFRSRFRLSDREKEYIASRGWERIAEQAEEILRTRLAPAMPRNDGKQTPMRGHPVFKAQHATGLCCRGCMAKWHNVPCGRVLTEEEIGYCVHILLCWLKEKSGDLPEVLSTPDLFR